MEIKSLECPKCGAPVQLPDGVGATYTCIFCQNSIAIPPELRGSAKQRPDNPTPSQPVVQISVRDVLFHGGMPDLQKIARWGDVKQLILHGQKIDAIKLVRELTDLGLKEAKDLVEQLERGEPVTISAQNNQMRQIDTTGDFVKLEEVIRSICSRGQKIEAIKILRQATNLGLKEAKDAVEQVEQGVPLQQALGNQGFTGKVIHNPQISSDQNNPSRVYNPRINQVKPKTSGGLNCVGCLVIFFILFFAIVLPLFLWAATSVDTFNMFLQKINPVSYAKLQTRFGEEGTGQGYFNDPRAITIDRDGFVYVADFGSGRIQRFDGQGKFLNLWVIPPPENTNDVYIESIAVGSDGRVYVVANGKIRIYDGTMGEEIGFVDITKPGEDHPIYVDQVTITSNNRLATVSGGEDILISNFQGNVELSIPKAMSSITKDSELSGALAIDGIGNMYLVGTFNDAVVKYTPDGTFTTKFGGEGSEPGQLSAVLAIAVDPFGQVFISDIHGISVFDGDGRFLRRFSVGASVFGIAFDADGNMWITTHKNQVSKYSLSR